MFFFFKRKEIVLDCFTHRPDTYEYFPIEKSTKHFPQWWKDLKVEIPDDYTIGQTMKNANYQLRSDPIIEKKDVGPWLMSTIEPDYARIPLEIGNGCR